MKVIKIRHCGECPHADVTFYCKKSGRPVKRRDDRPLPPEWCKLEDAPEE